MRTKEQLQQLFQLSKQRKAKEKQLQKEKYKKASEAIKKELADKLPTIIKITAQRQTVTPQTKSYETITIYNSSLIERQSDENELYQTREELQEWEKKHYPCINWNAWDNMVKRTKKLIYGKKKVIKQNS